MIFLNLINLQIKVRMNQVIQILSELKNIARQAQIKTNYQIFEKQKASWSAAFLHTVIMSGIPGQPWLKQDWIWLILDLAKNQQREIILKLNNPKIILLSRSEKLNHAKTHFLSQFKKKKRAKLTCLDQDSNLQSDDMKPIVLTITPWLLSCK